MKPESFFEKFDQFADAPDAVAKMRELVLDLAVQGKLAEHRPAEGDGHALLRQIHKTNPPSTTETDADPVHSDLMSFPSTTVLKNKALWCHLQVLCEVSHESESGSTFRAVL